MSRAPMSWPRDTFRRITTNRWVLVYFTVATTLMVFQHTTGWSWDFNVYSLNAQYLFHDGVYMEWLRPPAASVSLGLLQFVLPVRAAEFVYVLVISGFFLYAVVRLAVTYGLPVEVLYALTLSPFVIFTATRQGTELLYLAFVAMFFAEFRSPRSGLWMGLAFLTRYSGAILIPFVVFQRRNTLMILDLRAAKTLAVAGVIVSPWFAYNYLALGHPLASVANFYALNAVERGATTAFRPVDVAVIAGLGAVLVAAYLRHRTFDRLDAMMGVLAVITLLRQFGTDLKETRYLIELALVVGVLGTKGWARLADAGWPGLPDLRGRHVLAGIVVLHLVAAGAFVAANPLESPAPYRAAAAEAGECTAISDRWVHVAYAGTPAGPGDFRSTEALLEQGYRVIRFEGDRVQVEGTGCVEGPYDTPYIERLERIYGDVRYCSYLPVNTCGIERRLEGLGLRFA